MVVPGLESDVLVEDQRVGVCLVGSRGIDALWRSLDRIGGNGFPPASDRSVSAFVGKPVAGFRHPVYVPSIERPGLEIAIDDGGCPGVAWHQRYRENGYREKHPPVVASHSHRSAENREFLRRRARVDVAGRIDCAHLEDMRAELQVLVFLRRLTEIEWLVVELAEKD